jgi:hypothetical protein
VRVLVWVRGRRVQERPERGGVAAVLNPVEDAKAAPVPVVVPVTVAQHRLFTKDVVGQVKDLGCVAALCCTALHRPAPRGLCCVNVTPRGWAGSGARCFDAAGAARCAIGCGFTSGSPCGVPVAATVVCGGR